ncbi:hypothetical protein [Bradyrhizobium ivorense]|uniref:hypothetical protein n=1 Tax=Bradyrhizobium ivorense TaxID=2511166 RepID=UPI00111F1868|nr:hypothetical protein [Bradyrhizobium ivorense]
MSSQSDAGRLAPWRAIGPEIFLSDQNFARSLSGDLLRSPGGDVSFWQSMQMGRSNKCATLRMPFKPSLNDQSEKITAME